MPEEKARANRLRRTAAMQGFHLKKSRRHDSRAPDDGRWCLCSPKRDAFFLKDVNLDEVEAWLNLPWVEKLK